MSCLCQDLHSHSIPLLSALSYLCAKSYKLKTVYVIDYTYSPNPQPLLGYNLRHTHQLDLRHGSNARVTKKGLTGVFLDVEEILPLYWNTLIVMKTMMTGTSVAQTQAGRQILVDNLLMRKSAYRGGMYVLFQ